MVTYVGFLRAINLGAKRKFPKEAIISATEAAGFGDVATYLNTGNVRFDTAMRSRARIEATLERAYEASQGFEVPTIVFTQAELCDTADEADRLGEGHMGRQYVSLLKDAPAPAQARAIEERSSAEESVHVAGRAVHLLLGENYHEATVSNAAVEKVLGVATNRNVTVIRALRQKWC